MAHKRHRWPDVGVPTGDRENLSCLFLAFVRLKDIDVIGEGGVVERCDQLFVVVVVPHIAVAVRQGPQGDDVSKKVVTNTVLAHLTYRDLAGAVGKHVVVLGPCGIDRRFVYVAGVYAVAQILEIDSPVGVVGMFENAAGYFEFISGRSIHHVVERGCHVAQEVLQSWALGT